MKRRIIWPFLLTIPLLLILAGMLYFQFHYILWNDRIYPRDLETLDLSGETLSDLKKLAEFTELTDLNLSNTGLTFDQYDQITQLLPHCRIFWHVPFQGGYLASNTEALTLRSCSHQDIPALQYLQNLQSIKRNIFKKRFAGNLYFPTTIICKFTCLFKHVSAFNQ